MQIISSEVDDGYDTAPAYRYVFGGIDGEINIENDVAVNNVVVVPLASAAYLVETQKSEINDVRVVVDEKALSDIDENEESSEDSDTDEEHVHVKYDMVSGEYKEYVTPEPDLDIDEQPTEVADLNDVQVDVEIENVELPSGVGDKDQDDESEVVVVDFNDEDSQTENVPQETHVDIVALSAVVAVTDDVRVDVKDENHQASSDHGDLITVREMIDKIVQTDERTLPPEAVRVVATEGLDENWSLALSPTGTMPTREESIAVKRMREGDIRICLVMFITILMAIVLALIIYFSGEVPCRIFPFLRRRLPASPPPPLPTRIYKGDAWVLPFSRERGIWPFVSGRFFRESLKRWCFLKQSPEIWGIFQKLPEKLRKRGYDFIYVHVSRDFNSL